MAVNKTSGKNFSSGPISFSEIRKIFVENTSNPISFSSVYRDTNVNSSDPIVPDAAENANVPTSGTIDASDFRDTIKAIEVEQTGTDENLNVDNHINLFGADNLNKNIRKNFKIKGTVASKDPTKSALNLTTATPLKNVAIVNDGNIFGAGGSGGTSSASPTKGGNAMYIRSYVKVINNGNIWAGGGGGGRGGNGATGGTGGKGVYYTNIAQTCYNFISQYTFKNVTKTCYSNIAQTCYSNASYQQSYYSFYGYTKVSYFSGTTQVAKTCSYSTTAFKVCGDPWLNMCPQSSCSCTKSKSYQALCGFKDGRYQCTLQMCVQCGKTVNDQVTFQCPYSVAYTTYQAVTGAAAYLINNTITYQQPYNCSYQQPYQCDYQQSINTSYQQSFQCDYQQATYTSGGSGGSAGSGGNGGNGRGYNFDVPNSLNGAEGSSPGNPSDGGTNAGKGGVGSKGATGGTGGDWGLTGQNGNTADPATKGNDGNHTAGESPGSVGTSQFAAGPGNYIDGKDYVTLTNNKSTKGNTI